MGIKSHSFYICLMVHCFIHNSEATLSDNGEKHTKKKTRKWTTDKERDLIYFDVLTDTGEPKHFNRIRNMWHQEYPDLDVTDTALREKLKKLRKESREEGEYKSRFNWSEDLKRELLDVHYNTHPYRSSATTTLEEEWKRRHPDYPYGKKTLRQFVQNLSKEEMFQGSIPRDEESKRNYRHHWTAEWNNELRSLIRLTDTGEPYHSDRVKSEWYGKYPDSNVTDIALQNQFIRLRRMMKGKGEHERPFKWNEESDRELLELFFNTYPYKTDANITLEEEWKRRHQDHQATRTFLVNRARRLIRINRYPEYKDHDSSTIDLQWDDQHNSELMHVYNIALPKGGPYLRRTQQVWSKLHPQYEHVTPEQLKERLDHLKKKPPNENFPWTEEENRELLEIYDETVSQEKDQGQRIYDIWSQRHPRYHFMTPYYLQVHASNLSHRRKVKATGKKSNSKWTYEEKADLVDMADRYPREHSHERHAFHEEWVRQHPRLAYRNNSDLFCMAKRFERSGIKPRSLETIEGLQSGVLETRRQIRNKYASETKKELLDLFHRTFPRNYGHASRLMATWEKEGMSPMTVKAASLKKMLKKWEQRGPDKRADKAPMVYSSDEAGPSSPPIESEASE